MRHRSSGTSISPCGSSFEGAATPAWVYSSLSQLEQLLYLTPRSQRAGGIAIVPAAAKTAGLPLTNETRRKIDEMKQDVRMTAQRRKAVYSGIA